MATPLPRDLSKLPRARVDALRKIILAGYAPGGDMDAAFEAERELRAAIDNCPQAKTWIQPAPLPMVPVEVFRIRQRKRGRKPGSKVVNGRVIPPPVTVPITSQRVVVTEGAWSEVDSLSPDALERLRVSLLGALAPTSHRTTATANARPPAKRTTPTA